jgi:signal transduction histidine kinase
LICRWNAAEIGWHRAECGHFLPKTSNDDRGIKRGHASAISIALVHSVSATVESGTQTMSITFKYSAGYLVPVLLLAILAAAIYQGAEQFRASTLMEERSQQLVDEIQGLRADLIDDETSGRGYVITGNPVFLEPHLAATTNIPRRLITLESLTRDNPRQKERFQALRDLAEARMKYAQGVIDERRDAGFDAAANTVKTQQGKHLMDEARIIIAGMVADEAATLQRQHTATAVLFAWRKRGSIIGTLATVAIIAIIGIVLTRNISRRTGNLLNATRALGAGDLDYRVEPEGNDELTDLGRAINLMAEQLKEHKDAVDSFAYTVSHDLRAPLRAMQGFSQALVEDCGPQLNAQGLDYANRIVAATKRMEALIQDLLAYSRIGRTQMEIRPVALDAIVEDAVSSLSATIGDAHAAIKIEKPLPAVLGYRPIVQQVIANLITNAVKFVKPETMPEIRIYAEPRGATVRLWVEDNGIGINPEHHQRIFKVFERLHGAESYPGTGIGLAIVRKAIERMGGQAGLESALGQGSRFWIELPQGATA